VSLISFNLSKVVSARLGSSSSNISLCRDSSISLLSERERHLNVANRSGAILGRYLSWSVVRGTHRVSNFCRSQAIVRGGGRKILDQKKTGNARRGSNRSMICVGGAVNLGHSNQSDRGCKNRREKNILMASAFNLNYHVSLVTQKRCEPQVLRAFLKHINRQINLFSLYIIVSTQNQYVNICTRNIELTTCSTINSIRYFDLFRSDIILLDQNTMAYIGARYDS
jgi:ribosomal protein L4